MTLQSPSTTCRYLTPMDENALFAEGATSWRTDIITWRSLKKVVESADWRDPPGPIPEGVVFSTDKPFAVLTEAAREKAMDAIQSMVNDPSLIPGLRQIGFLKVNGLELFNGSIDHTWHHDGLSGRRYGHAGEFFTITYFGPETWDDAWGGHFEYGPRDLVGDWPSENMIPQGDILKIAPAARTTMMGWNQNPRFTHRSGPLTRKINRITMIAPLRLVPRT